VAAVIWSKTPILQDLIDEEIVQIDTQMLATINLCQVLDATKEHRFQYNEAMQWGREVLPQSCPRKDISRREDDAIH
jgi:hypothetical protein